MIGQAGACWSSSGVMAQGFGRSGRTCRRMSIALIAVLALTGSAEARAASARAAASHSLRSDRWSSPRSTGHVATSRSSCRPATENGLDARFEVATATVGAVVRLCGLTRASVPQRVILYLIATTMARRLGDARDGVRTPRRALGRVTRLLRPLQNGRVLRVAISAVPPGRYTLAYWCRSCQGLLGAIWPNRSITSTSGYATIRIQAVGGSRMASEGVIARNGVTLHAAQTWNLIAPGDAGIVDPTTVLVAGSPGARPLPNARCQIAAYRVPPTGAVVVVVRWRTITSGLDTRDSAARYPRRLHA